MERAWNLFEKYAVTLLCVSNSRIANKQVSYELLGAEWNRG